MKVRVNMYADLRRYAPGRAKSFDLDLSSGATVKTVLDTLKIPEAVKTVILINGRKADSDTRLAPGDKITIFPPLEGG